jgi:hypothetical protein
MGRNCVTQVAAAQALSNEPRAPTRLNMTERFARRIALAARLDAQSWRAGAQAPSPPILLV